MKPLNETELAAAVAQGDPQALGQLLKGLEKRVYNICLRMLGNRDDAAEVAQDAMLKTIEHAHDFRGQSALATWVIRIAMNLCISFLRKKKLRMTVSLDAPSPSDDQSGELRRQIQDQKEPDPAASVQMSEMIAHLQTAMARIDEDFRSVLVLRDIDELDYQAIAEVLAVPVGTVKSRLFRARLALRHELLQLSPPPRVASPQGGPGHG